MVTGIKNPQTVETLKERKRAIYISFETPKRHEEEKWELKPFFFKAPCSVGEPNNKPTSRTYSSLPLSRAIHPLPLQTTHPLPLQNTASSSALLPSPSDLSSFWICNQCNIQGPLDEISVQQEGGFFCSICDMVLVATGSTLPPQQTTTNPSIIQPTLQAESNQSAQPTRRKRGASREMSQKDLALKNFIAETV